MPNCELCGAETAKLKRTNVPGMGSMDLCESCVVRLASAYPSQKPQIVRELAAKRQRSALMK